MYNVKAKEFLLIFRKLSWNRLFNAFLVLSSYYISRILKRPVQWGFPVCISIEPTTACNLHCPECPSGLRTFSRPTGNLKIQDYIKWLDPLKNKLWSVNFYFQGEPFIHPQIHEAIAYASRSGIYTISSTNAHFIDEVQAEKIVKSGLDRLIISLDGTTQKSYEQYRIGGQLQKVLDGTKCLVEAKTKFQSKTPYLIFQFLVLRTNEYQLPELYRLAREYGVDEVKLKTAQVYNYENGSPLIPEQEIYSRYKRQNDGTYKIKNKLSNHCWKLWHAPVITWDGKVVPCCFDKDALHILGTLEHQSLPLVWKNNNYKTFRQQLLQSRKSINICTNCTEGTKIWA